MKIPGRITNGVVVLEGGVTLPEGTAVTVSCQVSPTGQPARKKRRVKLPLVKSNRPGALKLTNEVITRVLEEEDAANYGRFFKQPNR